MYGWHSRQIKGARLFVVGWALALLLLASPAAGHGIPCMDRDAVLDHLGRKYQEATVAAGVTNGGGLVEVLTTSDGSTWTIIVTTPQGMSCLVAAGNGWRTLKPKPGTAL